MSESTEERRIKCMKCGWEGSRSGLRQDVSVISSGFELSNVCPGCGIDERLMEKSKY